MTPFVGKPWQVLERRQVRRISRIDVWRFILLAYPPDAIHGFLAFESEGVMKTIFRIATLSLGLLLLVGCASTKTAYRAAPPSPKTAGSVTVVDERYVAIVENIARQRGTKVMWVNKPQKRVPNPVASVE
ncbi:MAG: hypothetical protein ACREO0_03290 [Pseudoxanthomonas sp.]